MYLFSLLLFHIIIIARTGKYIYVVFKNISSIQNRRRAGFLLVLFQRAFSLCFFSLQNCISFEDPQIISLEQHENREYMHTKPAKMNAE